MSKYNTINEFVAALVNNDGVEFHDSYGRRWKFEDSCFWFSDLGQEEFKEGLFATHLYGTEIRAVFGGTMNNGKMLNGDMPAAPTTKLTEGNHKVYMGLTKREHFAALAMEGLLANPNLDLNEYELGRDAVLRADQTLRALEAMEAP